MTVSPTEEYHQLQLGGIRNHSGYFRKGLHGESGISSNHILMPRSTEGGSWLRSKSLPWTSTQHFYRDPFGDPIPAESLEYQ